MANIDNGFEEFRRELIAHLSVRLALTPDVVASHLNAWLVQGDGTVADEAREIADLPPPRTRH